MTTPPPASTARSRPPSRPTTPLRRSNSRGSAHHLQLEGEEFPLSALEPAFAELSDSMAILEANMGDLQVMHDSLSRFSESFAAFLYGLNMNAFCVDFPEAPVKESFRRAAEIEQEEAARGERAGVQAHGHAHREMDAETTFMTTDSFVNEPQSTPAPPPQNPKTPLKTPARRGVTRGGARGARGGGGSGIARGGRGAAGR